MTQAYFIVRADGVSPMLAYNDVLIVTGKPGVTFTPETGTNKVGSYASDNLGTYTDSTHFNVLLYEKQCTLLKDGDGATPQFQIFLDNNAIKGKRLKNISLYFEGTWDDAQADQLSYTYIKYVATVD